MEPSVLLLLANFVAFALANVCPFPGLPKNGYGVNFHDNSEQFRHFFNWGARQYFEEGDVIQFRCEEGWATTLSKESEAIKCLSDGTWNATVPKCGNWQVCHSIKVLTDNLIFLKRKLSLKPIGKRSSFSLCTEKRPKTKPKEDGYNGPYFLIKILLEALLEIKIIGGITSSGKIFYSWFLTSRFVIRSPQIANLRTFTTLASAK